MNLKNLTNLETELRSIYENLSDEKLESMDHEEMIIAFTLISEGMSRLISLFKEEPTE
jgi:hypothetical protein